MGRFPPYACFDRKIKPNQDMRLYINGMPTESKRTNLRSSMCAFPCAFLCFFTFITCFIVQCANAAPTSAPKSRANSAAKNQAEAREPANQDLSKYIEAAASLHAYQSQNDPEHWQKFWQDFKEIVSRALLSHEDVSQVLKRIQGASELAASFADAGSVKIWSFPKIAESEQLLVMWQDSVARAPLRVGKRGGRLRKPLPPAIISRLEVISCLSGTAITSARLIPFSSSVSQSSSNSGSYPSSYQGSVKGESGKALILLGSERKTGGPWLQGYKLLGARWVIAPELFSAVPPFLIQNLTGKVSFNGNNLIISLGATQSSPNKGGDNQSSGGDYKIALIFTGDHYALDQKGGADPATTVAMQFVSAIESGRLDLVKGWLTDAKLASIPGYLGLYSHNGNLPPFKLVPMTVSAQNGIARFRLINFGKNDLILDIGKIKGQWAVKALFIAPPDAFAKKIVSTPPSAQ